MPDTADPEITEMADFDAERVDGVHKGANGFPFLVIKALDDEQPEPAVKADKGGAKALTVKEATDAVEDATQVLADRQSTLHRVLQGEQIAKADGAPDEPGSAAWETQDAATLTQAARMLASVGETLDAAQDREIAELQAGAEDDPGDAIDLSDAIDCLGAAAGIVARLAFSEQAEADTASQTDTADGVAKAGRKFSAASDKAIRAAIQSLTDLLDGGPNKPSEEDAVTKEQVEQMLDEKLDKILKAVTPADTETPETAEVAKAEAEAPAADETVPDDKTDAAKAQADSLEEIRKALGALPDTIKAAVDPVLDVVKGLEDRVANVEKQPAPAGPVLAGAGALLALRGQTDETDAGIDVARKALAAIKDPSARDEASRAIDQATLAELFRGRQGA